MSSKYGKALDAEIRKNEMIDLKKRKIKDNANTDKLLDYMKINEIK